MTALKQFERLEAPALWRAPDAAQRREVYVNFGDTMLVIRDKHETVLAHWSLAATRRINPGQRPALFAPGKGDAETLEFEDDTMIDAIERVRKAIERRRPRPGRLRLYVGLLVTVLVLAVGIFWLPGALISHLTRVVPFETRHQIGRDLLVEISRLSGLPCTSAAGKPALRRLEARLLTEARGTIVVLKDGIAQSARLPGGLILVNKRHLEDHENPDILAGYVLLERVHTEITDPLRALLEQVGGFEAFRLLTTGKVAGPALASYAETILTAESDLPETARLLAAFAEARLPASPLAYDLDPTGETTLALIEADPYRNLPYPPVLPDATWVALQGICGG